MRDNLFNIAVAYVMSAYLYFYHLFALLYRWKSDLKILWQLICPWPRGSSCFLWTERKWMMGW